MFPADAPTWGVLALAAGLVGFAKTGINGVGSLAIVLFAAVVPARASTGALLPVLIAADLIASRLYRHDVDWLLLARLAPWVVLGTGLGSVVLHLADDSTMRVAIAAILLVMTGFQLLIKCRPLSAGDGAEPSKSGPRRRSAAAIAVGTWSGLLVVNRINQRTFELATLTFSAVGAALLII